MRTIFNTEVKLKSTAMLKRLLSAVEEKGLDVHRNDFEKSDYFRKGCGYNFGNWNQSMNSEEVTEQEFLELLKEYKP